MEIKLGSEVWVYEPPWKPVEGIVSEIHDHWIRVKINRRFTPDKTYIKSHVFLRPQEHNKLLCKLVDDSHALSFYAKELRRINENHTNLSM